MHDEWDIVHAALGTESILPMQQNPCFAPSLQHLKKSEQEEMPCWNVSIHVRNHKRGTVQISHTEDEDGCYKLDNRALMTVFPPFDEVDRKVKLTLLLYQHQIIHTKRISLVQGLQSSYL